MKIKRFTIKNFRSFKSAKVFNVDSNYIAFTGENNCGKSNVLRALDLFFNGKIENKDFDAFLDMHAYTVNENGKEKTTISVTVELNNKHDKQVISKFNELVKFNIIKNFTADNVTLSLNIQRSNYSQVQYFDPITGQKFQPKEIQDLFYNEFRKSINYLYIPAVKDLNNFINKDITYELTKRIFNTWGRGRNPMAQDFKNKFDNIKQSIQDIIASANLNITDILQEQSPQIKNFLFNIPFNDITQFLSSLPISINDSIVTDISRKGSGIQAITMFSLLRYLDKYKPTNKYSNSQYIWAIEEPETFLHPKAQRNLFSALIKYSEETPILITTHSYHFLNTNNTLSNYLLVKENIFDSEYTQTSIFPHTASNQWQPFLNILGAYVPDFIPTSGYDKIYLFLEGVNDIRYFKKMLSFHPEIKDFFEKNIEIVDSNGDEIKKKAKDALVLYKLKCIVLVDGDEKGNTYYENLISHGYTEGETIFKLAVDKMLLPTMEGVVTKNKADLFKATMPENALNYWYQPKALSLFDNLPETPPAGWDKNSIKNKMCSFIEANGEIDDFIILKNYLDKIYKSAKKML